jgi:hypothetical protein
MAMRLVIGCLRLRGRHAGSAAAAQEPRRSLARAAVPGSRRFHIRGCGYRTGAIGKPEDKSTPDEIKKRWVILKQAKKDWIEVYTKTDVMKNSRLKEKAFKHPSSPIRPPGTSMHGTGYAIDMAGKSGDIERICKYLGASLIYKEPGNYHIEFKSGVANKPVKGK